MGAKDSVRFLIRLSHLAKIGTDLSLLQPPRKVLKFKLQILLYNVPVLYEEETNNARIIRMNLFRIKIYNNFIAVNSRLYVIV